MSFISSIEPAKLRQLLTGLCVFSVIALVGLGVMAKNGWLPSTDPLSGEKRGWFGRKLPKNASSIWNSLAAPMPTRCC